MGTGDGGSGNNATGCVSGWWRHLRGVLWMVERATAAVATTRWGGTGKWRQKDAFLGYYIRHQGNNDACEALLHVNSSANGIKELGERNCKKRIV